MEPEELYFGILRNKRAHNIPRDQANYTILRKILGAKGIERTIRNFSDHDEVFGYLLAVIDSHAKKDTIKLYSGIPDGEIDGLHFDSLSVAQLNLILGKDHVISERDVRYSVIDDFLPVYSVGKATNQEK